MTLLLRVDEYTDHVCLHKLVFLPVADSVI